MSDRPTKVCREGKRYLSPRRESSHNFHLSALSLYLAENPRPQENEVDEEQTFNDRNGKLLKERNLSKLSLPLPNCKPPSSTLCDPYSLFLDD